MQGTTNRITTVPEFEALVEGLPTSIVTVDTDGTIVFANKQTEHLFGYSRAQLLGEPIELLLPERFRKHHPALRSGFVTAPQARPMGVGRDLFGLHRDGSEFPIEIGLNPIQTDQGLLIVSAIIDITDRKRLEQRFRASVESAPTAMVMVDGAGTIVLVNAETETLFKYERDELIGQKVELLVPSLYAARHPGLRTQYLTDPRSRRMGAGRDLYARRKGGDEFPVEIGLNPIRTDEGKFVLAAVVDLMERKRTEERLQSANEALVASNLELKQFAYIASHDLQEPLRTINGYAQLLQGDYAGKLDARADLYIDTIVNAVGLLHTLVDNLRSIAKIEAAARPLAETDMNEVFDATVALLAGSIEDADASVTRDTLPKVLGDAPQLTHLLSNLISNSLKFVNESAPAVHVSARRDGDIWTLSVADNGIGIESRHYERIFEIFRRLHPSSTYPGTGIGLALCRRIMRRHGGEIWVDSEPSKGSVFSFTLRDSAAVEE